MKMKLIGLITLTSLVACSAPKLFRDLQVGFGTRDASSLLEVFSTTQGSRPAPSMTETQRDAISSPATGLTVYNTTTGYVNYYNGTSWLELSSLTGAEVLTGKDIDGGTASNTSRITVPKDTTTNLDLLTDKQGTVAWDTTQNTLVGNDGTGWAQIGGGNNAITVLPRQVPTGTLAASFNKTIFGTETVDTANAYNTTTGVYTAQSDGYLLASAQIRISYTAATVFTQLRIINVTTGQYVFTVYSTGASSSIARISVSGILAVSLNDTVEVQIYTGGASAAYVNDANFGTNSASFYILRQ